MITWRVRLPLSNQNKARESPNAVYHVRTKSNCGGLRCRKKEKFNEINLF